MAMMTQNKRNNIWKGLKRVHRYVSGPWIIGEGFNDISNLNERLGSAVTLKEVLSFRNCVC